MRNQEPRTDKSDWSVQTSYALNKSQTTMFYAQNSVGIVRYPGKWSTLPDSLLTTVYLDLYFM